MGRPTVRAAALPTLLAFSSPTSAGLSPQEMRASQRSARNALKASSGRRTNASWRRTMAPDLIPHGRHVNLSVFPRQAGGE